jgi:alpha-tubulin suppressor-like RCC1 family protein
VPALSSMAAAGGSSTNGGSAAATGSEAGGGVAVLACGWRHTLAVMADGRVSAYGRGVNGQLGIGVEEDRCVARRGATGAAVDRVRSRGHGAGEWDM